MADPAVLRELERKLEEVGSIGVRPADVRPTVSTGVPILDAVLPRGGLPRGEPVEWLGPRSCGKTALLRSVLLRLRYAGEPVAIVDAGRTLFSPDWVEARAGEGAFWIVRPPSREEAAWCSDLLLRSGSFGAVALLLGDEPGGASSSGSPGRAGPGLRRSVSVRLQRLAEEAGTVFVVGGASPLAALRLRFRPGRVEPVTGVPFAPFLPAIRPVWVRVEWGRSAEIPVLCPEPGGGRPRRPGKDGAIRDRKGRR
ncbi:MAG: hypothetical protein Q8W51_07300 [Candidatus Palauibacterales bacterium]|nr:hypothetical protein [Candidatus Palauibacterales bacterium]MDP2529528.1 hypothetical protein [Candidatus Palauibacterales bacterium]MDP2584132.1 hypothetical protein [Candidatus Palauibacterales bacterium]